MFSRLLFLILFPLFCLSQTHETWKHVYDKERLHIIHDSVTITGKIMHISAEVDGDIHIQVKVDSQFTCLLNKFNFSKQKGCLVAEIVCVNPSPFKPCWNYTNTIQYPIIGDVIEMTGAYVFDNRHKWMEIHPIYEMKFISRIIW